MSKLVFPDDYKNTGIYVRNTKMPETNILNTQLQEMYINWLENINNNINALGGYDFSEYNGLQYLTCFDSYLQSTSRIMIFGREANSADYAFDKRIENFKHIYRHDLYYSYEYAISHPQDSYAKHRAKTRFLQTRKLICGFDDNKASEKDILSVLVNNLNKISKGGKYTPCDDNIDKIIYSDFSYNGLKANVFIHELNILRPTHIIFLCGKGYNNHIKRDFGETFLNKINEKINRLSVKKEPVSETITLHEQVIKDLFGLSDYYQLDIIFTLHPSAHMSAGIRKTYEDILTDFIKES